MKDVRFSDLSGDDFDTKDIPVLTPEEIKLIKQRRRQRLNDLNSAQQNDESFYSRATQIPEPNQNFYSKNTQSYNTDYEFDPNDFYISKKRTQNHDEPSEYEDIKSGNRSSKSRSNYDDPPKKRKGGCLAGALIALLLAAVIAFTGSFGYVYSLMGKTNYTESTANKYVSSAELKSDSKIKNILLIGLDDSDGGKSRSDTMMLISIDTANKKLKLTSFLRDMWVDIPDHKSAKLNASYAYGGAQLTMDTIEYNFGVDIDHYLSVNFDMFKKIIDALGGITVDITEKEAKFINKTTSSTVNAGPCLLDGKKALIYARIRKLDSDFYRTQRQRKVISAIISKATKTNPVKLLKMVSDIMPLLTTDIPSMDMTVLAFSSLGYIKYDIEQLQVPADDAYKSKYIKRQSALVPDIEKNKKNIHNFIYG